MDMKAPVTLFFTGQGSLLIILVREDNNIWNLAENMKTKSENAFTERKKKVRTQCIIGVQ